MRETELNLCGHKASLYGAPSERVYLFLHGKSGSRKEARAFANLACPAGYEVLGVDLPGHGERADEKNAFDPWHIVPELETLGITLFERWKEVSVRANSIGAWFLMQSFSPDRLNRCLFVSPILDMEALILSMMRYASITEQELAEKGEIATSFGETLSLKYLQYVRAHPIRRWSCPTSILYAGRDTLTPRETVDAFCDRFRCELTVMEDGEHWFHTPEQLAVLAKWERASL